MNSAAKVQSLCRTCRKEHKNQYTQIPVETPDLYGKSIGDMIYELTDIMVAYDHQLPQWICPECLEELRAAYNFRQKCIDSNTILSQLVPNLLDSSGADASGLLMVKPEDTSSDFDQWSNTTVADDEHFELVESNVDPPSAKRRKGSNQPQSSGTASSAKKRTRAPPKVDTSFPYDRSKTQQKRRFRDIVQEFMHVDGTFLRCVIDKSANCKYNQDCTKLDIGNFIRHCRTMHPKEAFREGLAIPKEGQTFVEPRKARTKQEQFDQTHLHRMEACVKLVAMHNLPANCFDWDALRILLEPLAQSLDQEIGIGEVFDWTHIAVENLRDQIRSEIRNRLVSVKVESAGNRGGQQYLIVSVQFEYYASVVMRVLGVLRVVEDGSGSYVKQLVPMVMKLLACYNISNEQIFAFVIGNEAQMLASGCKLRKAFADTMTDVGEWELDNGDVEPNYVLFSLSLEVKAQCNAIQDAVCSLHKIVSSVVSKFGTGIDRIQRFVQDVNDPKYKEFFESNNVPHPPLAWSRQWYVLYEIAERIIQQEKFYLQLFRKYPLLALNESDWTFLRDCKNAFHQLHELIELVQDEPATPFSEFYMRWLLAIKDVRGKTGNQFSAKLVEALSKQLVSLKENMVFKAALYLDPRFNYLRSVVFTAEQKEETQNYIVSIWNRIQNLRSDSGADTTTADGAKQEDTKDDMDDFLSEMFGGPSKGKAKPLPVPLTSSVTPILAQLKSLEIEPRQAHNYDVWKHWLLRAETHPELFSVAMVVLSLPSNTVDLQRAFSALVLSDRRDDLSEKNLEELLLVRLNRQLFERTVLSMTDWKQILGS